MPLRYDVAKVSWTPCHRIVLEPITVECGCEVVPRRVTPSLVSQAYLQTQQPVDIFNLTTITVRRMRNRTNSVAYGSRPIINEIVPGTLYLVSSFTISRYSANPFIRLREEVATLWGTSEGVR